MKKQALLEHYNQWETRVFVLLATIIGQVELLSLRYDNLLNEDQKKCLTGINHQASLGIAYWCELNDGIHKQTLSDDELDALYISKIHDLIGRLSGIRSYCELLGDAKVGHLKAKQSQLVNEVLAEVDIVRECCNDYLDIRRT